MMIVLVVLVMYLNYQNLTLPFSFQQQALAGTLVAGAGSAIETDPFKRQQAGPPAGMSLSRARLRWPQAQRLRSGTYSSVATCF